MNSKPVITYGDLRDDLLDRYDEFEKKFVGTPTASEKTAKAVTEWMFQWKGEKVECYVLPQSTGISGGFLLQYTDKSNTGHKLNLVNECADKLSHVVCESGDQFEEIFADAMIKNYFVIDADNLKEKRVGFIVVNGDGKTWYTFGEADYEKYLTC